MQPHPHSHPPSSFFHPLSALAHLALLVLTLERRAASGGERVGLENLYSEAEKLLDKWPSLKATKPNTSAARLPRLVAESCFASKWGVANCV